MVCAFNCCDKFLLKLFALIGTLHFSGAFYFSVKQFQALLRTSIWEQKPNFTITIYNLTITISTIIKECIFLEKVRKLVRLSKVSSKLKY